jgi:hypothetical protein
MRCAPCATRQIGLVLSLLLLPACTYIEGSDRVLVTSAPAGGRIAVNGLDTGWTTPRDFNLANFGSHDHLITVTKKGYEPESRQVYMHRQTRMSQWTEGAVEDLQFTWPIFWTFGDFFFPFEYSWQFVPREVFMQLYPQGQAPVRAETGSKE